MYKVILINEVQSGFVLEEAKRQLSEKVKLTEAQLNKILSSSCYAVLKTEKRELANGVASMIQNCGFSAEIVADNRDYAGTPISCPKPSDVGAENAMWAAVERMRNRLSSVWRKEYKMGGAIALLSIMLLVISVAEVLVTRHTLEDAADYALDSILLSGAPVAPDLQTRFARSDIRRCFSEKVPSWKPAYYDVYINALNQIGEMRGQTSRLQAYQSALEREHPAVASLVMAALVCPEEFTLN